MGVVSRFTNSPRSSVPSPAQPVLEFVGLSARGVSACEFIRGRVVSSVEASRPAAGKSRCPGAAGDMAVASQSGVLAVLKSQLRRVSRPLPDESPPRVSRVALGRQSQLSRVSPRDALRDAVSRLRRAAHAEVVSRMAARLAAGSSDRVGLRRAPLRSVQLPALEAASRRVASIAPAPRSEGSKWRCEVLRAVASRPRCTRRSHRLQ